MRAFFVRSLLKILSGLPLAFVHKLGDLLGRSLTLFPNDLRDTAHTNIARCFPQWTAQQQRQLVLQCLQQTARATLESGALWLLPPERVLSLLKKVSGEDMLAQAMEKGKGVILAIPHLGAWEMVGLYGSTHWPMTSLYRPPRQPYLGELIRAGRERAGAKLVPTDASGVRALYKALGRGELIAILPDQDPDRSSGVFAPFFGVQANTMTLLSRLASKSGATVLMAFAERLPKGEGFHLHFQNTEAALSDGDAAQAAASLNQAIEQCALQQPAQYQWAYKRFKTRPPGEAKFY